MEQHLEKYEVMSQSPIYTQIKPYGREPTRAEMKYYHEHMDLIQGLEVTTKQSSVKTNVHTGHTAAIPKLMKDDVVEQFYCARPDKPRITAG